MPDFEQNERPIGVETVLGMDEVVLRSFNGDEQISDLFNFDLELLADVDKPVVKPDDIVGTRVDFYVRHPGGEKRYFNGFINRFSYAGSGSRGHLYRAHVVPWLWFLSRASDCRVHESGEGQTAKDIVEGVFRQFGFTDFKWNVKRTLEKREFCVQYEETHFDFVSRLLQYEGIYYYFSHEKGKHTLVLSDNKDGAEDCPQDSEVSLASDLSQPELTDKIASWHHEYSFTTGKWAHTDYNFTMSATDLEQTTKSVVKTPGIGKYEQYSDAASYREATVGKELLDARIQELECGYDVVSGSGCCRGFSPGGRFMMEKHYEKSEEGKKWVLTGVRHDATMGGSYVTGGGAADEIYSNSFQCIPADVPYRPARTAPRPRIRGIQTAMVVGPAGDEIYTDEYGRVKVQFHWDREGLEDSNSSFWVRTAQPWTGKNWGMAGIPRIGQEVVIDFINGDPDRPLLMGMLYNDQTMPPYTLPESKTQTGIKTQSTPGGDEETFNELRFEDKIGEEEIYIHAEKDLNTVIENNETRKVGHDKMDPGDQEIDIYNDQKITVGVGAGGGSQITEIEKDQKTTVNSGDHVTKVRLGKTTHEAMTSIELIVGQSSIKIEPAKITIKSVQIAIEADAQAEVKSLKTTVSGDAMLTLKGGVTMIN